MKQVFRRVIDSKGEIVIEDVPVPSVGKHDVLIDARSSVISSGTEIATLNKTLPELVRQTLSDPWMRQAVKNVLASGGVLGTADRVHDELIAYRLIGYSGAGVVLQVGEAVLGLSPGDRVAYAGQGHGEIVKASRNQVVAIPSGLDFNEAAFSTVGAIALQGVRRAGVELGEVVAVIGLGLVGQLVFQLAQAAGARCIGVEPTEWRRKLALEMGLWQVVEASTDEAIRKVLELTGGAGADRVIICASGKNKTIANSALKMCRAHGRVTVVGIVPMELERMPFFRKELDFVFSRAYGPGPFDADWESGRTEYPPEYVRWDAKRNMEAFLQMVALQRVKIKPLISAEYPIEEAQEAYRSVYDGETMAAVFSFAPSQGSEVLQTMVSIKTGKQSRPAMGSKVRVGFIGCGNFSRSVLLPEMHRIAEAKIHAIAASSGINAKPMAEKYGASYVTTDVEKLLADKDIDAVVIATRHHLHAGFAKAALLAGKHVLVEKPLAMNVSDAIEIAKLAQEKNLHLVVGHNRRYAPLTQRLLQSRGNSGPAMTQYVVSIKPLMPDHWTLNPVEGGGRLIGESDHFLDILNLFSGSTPHSVTAGAHVDDGKNFLQSCNFSVMIKYKNGSTGLLMYTDLGHGKFPRERFEVFSGGRVFRLEDYAKAEVLGHGGWKASGKVRMGHSEELRNFVGVILGNAIQQGAVEESLSATLVTQCAFISMRENKSIAISDMVAMNGAVLPCRAICESVFHGQQAAAVAEEESSPHDCC
ncbi:MAG: Gfo/Idh/MocA family oxidoreductase [Desulfobulbaceae bacterium]|nr:Gfo/Idh/MocA family oxidoreductase [Desulfobulbaceae bacterium]